ncbi:MAG: hypothetical protein WBA93_13955, partial [Microcoleaceae cyanobacterium]
NFAVDKNRADINSEQDRGIYSDTFHLIAEQKVETFEPTSLDLSESNSIPENLEKSTQDKNRAEIHPDQNRGIYSDTFHLIAEQKVETFEPTSLDLSESNSIEENLEKSSLATNFEHLDLQANFAKDKNRADINPDQDREIYRDTFDLIAEQKVETFEHNSVDLRESNSIPENLEK